MENTKYFDFEPKRDRRLENNSVEYNQKEKMPQDGSTVTWVVDTLGNVVQVEVPLNVELNITRNILARAESPLGMALLGFDQQTH